MHAVLRDLEVDGVERLQAAEPHDDTAHLEHRLLALQRPRRMGECQSDIATRAELAELSVLVHPSRPDLADDLLQEPHDPVGQVENDTENHQAEDSQPVLGDVLQHEGKHDETRHRHQRDRQLPQREAGAGHRPGDVASDRDRNAEAEHAKQRHIRQEVRQDDDHRRPEDGAGAGLSPAQRHGQQEQHRQLEGEGARRDVLLGEREEPTRQARQRRADDEGQHLVPVHRDTHAVGGDGAAAKGDEGAPEVGLQQPRHRNQRQDHHREGEVVEVDGRHLVTQHDRLAQLQSLRAVGEEVHLVEQDGDDRPEGERHHREIRPRDAQSGNGQHGAEAGGDRHGGGQGDPERQPGLHGDHTGRIRADAEQPGMTQRDFTRVADHDVEPEKQNGIDADDDEQVDVIRVRGDERKCGQCEQQGRDGDCLAACHAHTFLMIVLPNRPAGFTASTRRRSTRPGTSL